MKAILVMDMPETCEDCWMYFEDHKRVNYDGTPRKICPAINGWAHIDDEKIRPDWCPLIPAIGYVQPVGHVVSWEDDNNDMS